jgi:hypothetical protein
MGCNYDEHFLEEALCKTNKQEVEVNPFLSQPTPLNCYLYMEYKLTLPLRFDQLLAGEKWRHPSDKTAPSSKEALSHGTDCTEWAK